MVLATLGALSLELALIRWLSSQIRMFAYFGNLILIAGFLGLGLGIALGQRKTRLFHWTLPALLVLSVIVTFADSLQIYKLGFPDPSVFLWGADRAQAFMGFTASLAVMLVIFWLVVAVFICAGSVVGGLFSMMPPLKAYRWDLIGSIGGVVTVTVMSSLGCGPGFWLLPGCVAYTLLSGRVLSGLAGLAVVLLGGYSGIDAIHSPYNQIRIVTEDLDQNTDCMLLVNRDFHQSIHDVSDGRLNRPGISDNERTERTWIRSVYEIPFVIGSGRGSACIVGAGTGNDVQGALRSGFAAVHAVDIDARIIEIGRRYHPEKPYDQSRVIRVTEDARAFFEQYKGPPFDVVCYGLLDSHAMFSSMSTLRLENYVYTEEGVRAAWDHVAPGGLLSVSFSVFAGDWISDRMFWTIAKATGVTPTIIDHGLNWGRTFVVARPGARIDLAGLSGMSIIKPTSAVTNVRTTSDDWPFLYVRPGSFPLGYLVLVSLVLGTGFLAAHRVFGRQVLGSGFDPPLFLMGAAFLLIETRGITNLSLLFGSTWIVNSAVFLGILLMALLANTVVEHFRPQDARPWFIPVLLAVALLWILPSSILNSSGLLTRGLLGGLLNGLPVGFAGVAFSLLLLRSRNPGASLGSNLLGALVGGCLEYLSMWVGLKAMALVALGLYLAAFALVARNQARTVSPAA